MKTLGYLVLGLFVTLALPACNTAEKYARNSAAAQQWLAANAGSTSINVSGRWHAEGWGGSTLTQSGNKITGTLGDYSVNGVVKGRVVYLALTADRWAFYTVMAKLTPSGALEGFYSSSVPYAPADERSFSMVRTNL